MRTTDMRTTSTRPAGRRPAGRPTARTLRMAAAVAGVAVVGSASAVYALSLEPDGVNLRAQWTTGGEAWLELEDRNVRPAICFVWAHDAPQDGDSIASRVLTVGGTEVVDLGTGDQWIEGEASGCEIPTDDAYRDVFARPSDYVVEFRVVDEQGTPVTPPVRSGPLAPATS